MFRLSPEPLRGFHRESRLRPPNHNALVSNHAQAGSLSILFLDSDGDRTQLEHRVKFDLQLLADPNVDHYA